MAIPKAFFFAGAAILLLTSLVLFGSSIQADGPPPGVDTAQRDDVVPEDMVGGISGTEGGLPNVDTAQRDDWVLDVGEGGTYSTEGGLPGVDTAERDDVVPEEGGTAGAEGVLPNVDTAERDDVVPEEAEGGTTGAKGVLPNVDTAERDDVVPEEAEGGTAGAEGVLPNVDTAGRDDVVPEEAEGGTTGAEGVLPNMDTAERDDVVPEDGATGSVSRAPAPTGLKVTSDTDDSVSLSWTAVTNANGYKVEYRKGSTGSWLHAGYAGSRTSYTVGSLTCETAYQFRVKARGDGDPYSRIYGDPSSSVSETTDDCLAPAPTGLKVTSDTDDSVSLSWTAVANANGYKVEYRKGSTGSWLHAGYAGSRTSYTVGSLTCETAYQFRVKARGDGDPYSRIYGDPSSSVSETTDDCLAPAPTGLKVTSDTDDSVSLSWTAVANANGYKVEYRKGSTGSWLHAGYAGSRTSYTVGSLTCETAYQFRVKARGDGDPYSRIYGDPSSSVSETTDDCLAPAPTGLKVTSDTDDSISLSWTAVANANGYKVEYRKGSTGSWLHAGYAGSRTSYTVGSLTCETAYQFRVKARGDGDPYSRTYGDPSSSVSETTDDCVAPAPTGLRVTSDTQSSVNLSWTEVTDAGAYKVEYRRGSSGSWLHATYVFSGSSARVGSLDCDTAYQFRVKARGDGNPYSYTYGDPSSSVTETTDICSPPAPTGLKVTSDTDTTVSLSWTAVTDAAAYKVEYRESGDAIWLHAGYVYSGTSATVDGLSGSTTYEFRVRARGDGNPYSLLYGNPSSSVSGTTDAPTISSPTGLKVSSDTDTTVTLSWTAVSDAGAYKVEYRRSDSSDWLHASYVYTAVSDTVDRLVCNTGYQFRVRARGDGDPYSYTYSAPSSSVTETTDECPPTPAPTGLAVTGSTGDSVSLEWNPVTDAHRYRLEQRRGTTGSWTAVGSETSAASQTATGLDCNTTYYFRVSARGDGNPYSTAFGNPSTVSVSGITSSCPDAPAPSGLSATGATENGVTLGWNPVTDAQRYRLERSLDGSTGWTTADSGAGSIAATSYTVAGLTCDTTYYFRVSARGDGTPYSSTFGTASASVSKKTGACAVPSPTGLKATVSGENGVSLTWGMVSGADKYRVERSLAGDDEWTVVSEAVTITSYTDSGLDCGTEYDFRVSAYSNAKMKWSSPSSLISVTTSDCPANPKFPADQYETKVTEGLAAKSNVLRVKATDPDGGGLNYSIAGGNFGGAFTIAQQTGQITTTGNLDFEVAASYELVVVAEDRQDNSRQDTTTVSLSVTNVNEAPDFAPDSYAFAIPLVSRNSSSRVLVGGIRAYDPDAEDIVTYSISSGNSGNIFTVDGVGRLWATPSVLPSTATDYSLAILASDGNGQTDTAKVSVKLTSLPIAALRLNQDRFNEGEGITATVALTNLGSTPVADLPNFSLQVQEVSSSSRTDGVVGTAVTLPSYDIAFPAGVSSVSKSVSIAQASHTMQVKLVLTANGSNASKAAISNGVLPVMVNDRDIAIGESQTGEWGILEPLSASPSASLEEPNAREFSLTVPQGVGTRNVRIDLTSGDRDSVLILKDNSGDVLEWNDDGGVSFDARIVRPLTPGAYKILAHTQWGGDDGKFQLSVSYSDDPPTDPDNETAGIATENPRRDISVESHTFTSSPSWNKQDCSVSISSARQGEVLCIEIKGKDFEAGDEALAVLLTRADHQLGDIPLGAIALEYVNATTMRGMWVAQRLSRYAESASGPMPYRVAVVGYDSLSTELSVSPPLTRKMDLQGAEDPYEAAKKLLKQLGFEDPDSVFETLWILYGEDNGYTGVQAFASEFAEGAIQGEWGINSNPNRGIAYFAGWMIVGFVPVVDIGPDVRDFFAFEVVKCSGWKCSFSLSGLGLDLVDGLAIIPGIGKFGDVPQVGKIIRKAAESNTVGYLASSLKHAPDHIKCILKGKRGYWVKHPWERGRAIEDDLFKQHQVPDLLNLNTSIHQNFPGIDYFDKAHNIAISVKSIDPGADRYKTSRGAFNPAAFEKTVRDYLDDLKKVDPRVLHMKVINKNKKGGEVQLNVNFMNNPVFASRHIDLVLPANPSASVIASLSKIRTYAMSQNVGINFYTTSASGGKPFTSFSLNP